MIYNDIPSLVDYLRSLREQSPENFRPLLDLVVDSLAEGVEQLRSEMLRYSQGIDGHTSILRRLAFDLAATDDNKGLAIRDLLELSNRVAAAADNLDGLRRDAEVRTHEMEGIIKLLRDF